MAQRPQRDPLREPMSIYEVHLGSWRRKTDGLEWLTYVELADSLVTYVKEMGYTHIELMPVDRASATTKASKAQAVASPTAAQLMAVVPNPLLIIPRSLRIRASTGNAVMDMAIPMNSAKETNELPAVANDG